MCRYLTDFTLVLVGLFNLLIKNDLLLQLNAVTLNYACEEKKSLQLGGVVVFIESVPTLWRPDLRSHIAKEPFNCKTSKFHQNEHTPAYPLSEILATLDI